MATEGPVAESVYVGIVEGPGSRWARRLTATLHVCGALFLVGILGVAAVGPPPMRGTMGYLEVGLFFLLAGGSIVSVLRVALGLWRECNLRLEDLLLTLGAVVATEGALARWGFEADMLGEDKLLPLAVLGPLFLVLSAAGTAWGSEAAARLDSRGRLARWGLILAGWLAIAGGLLLLSTLERWIGSPRNAPYGGPFAPFRGPIGLTLLLPSLLVQGHLRKS